MYENVGAAAAIKAAASVVAATAATVAVPQAQLFSHIHIKA